MVCAIHLHASALGIHEPIGAFELRCWRRLLRVPWTARRSNQFILKKISPEYSLEGLMLKLKLQYFGHLREELTHLKRPWCWERLRARGEDDDRGWDGWMASPTQWTWVWVNSRSWWWTGWPGVLRFMVSQRVGHDWATELNWILTFQKVLTVASFFIVVSTVSLVCIIPSVSNTFPPCSQNSYFFKDSFLCQSLFYLLWGTSHSPLQPSLGNHFRFPFWP